MSRPKNEPGLPTWRGDALRLRRLAAGWTTGTLAERVGVSKSTIARWESGIHAPTSEDVARLAAALDVAITVFAKEPRVV
jgi:transcriptional regulator with XRE-family HTH domain|tara:strand:+ start:594 stop:833 length:240 start_codon:yes stop_codon:yes gene_type:complete